MRKRLVLALMTGLAIAALVSGPAAQADPATVIDDIGCFITAADSGLAVGLATTESHAVRSASGNVTLTCHFTIPVANLPTATMRHRGFACATPWGVTTKTLSVTTKGGTVLLRCQIKA